MTQLLRKVSLPVIPLRDMVVFPGAKVPFVVGRAASIAAVKAATAAHREVLLVMQRDADVTDPAPRDLHAWGTVGRILHDVGLADGNCKLLVEGLSRARITDMRRQGTHLVADATRVEVDDTPSAEHHAARVRVLTAFDEFVKTAGGAGLETVSALLHGGETTRGCDELLARLAVSGREKQELLETLDGTEMLRKIETLLHVEIDKARLDQRLHAQVQRQVEQAQREYLLNEKMKAIQKELGRRTETPDAEALEKKARDAGLPPAAMEKALQEIQRLEAMAPMSAEATVSRSYIEWLVALQWKKRSRERRDFDRAAAILAEDHHGLDKIKERILEFLAVRSLQGGKPGRGSILCFAGPPGVGKTSLGRSIARATGRTFVRMSLGGVRDEAEIRGHRRTYIGAYPGRILQMMRKAGTRNPVFLLDEIDKLASDFRGDPAAALLEVLDPESNSSFVDHYVDTEYDLSEVMFICTANLMEPIPAALRDRLEVLRLPGYTTTEKVAIAERFLLPKQRTAAGLGDEQLTIARPAVQGIVEHYTREAGVRQLEREMGSLARKVAARVVRQRDTRVSLTSVEDVQGLLGVPRFRLDVAELVPAVGVATGLSWTEMGGQVLSVEATRMRGKGKLLVTGQLGDVMQESLQAAVSYVRTRADSLGLADDFFRENDIHVHVPEGAIPKDGPSAGITLATAVVSALTGRPVRHDVAINGEITLRGRVLPVGGVKEKLMAAHRLGIRDVVLPKDNARDLEDVPPEVREELHVSLVESMDEVLAIVLLADTAREAVSPPASELSAGDTDDAGRTRIGPPQ